MHDMPTEQRITYLRGLLQRYGTLSLPLGFGLSFSLIQVFQPLRLRQSVADKKKPDNEETLRDTYNDAGENDEAEEREEALDVLVENGIEALSKSPRGRLVILLSHILDCETWASLFLGAIHSRRVAERLLAFREHYPGREQQIYHVFVDLGEYAPVDFLLSELRSRDKQRVQNAQKALCKLGRYIPVGRLIPWLADEDGELQSAVAAILTAAAKTAELPAIDLLNILQSSNSETLFHTARVLACLQHPAALDPLVARLTDPNAETRRLAVVALGCYKTQAPIDKIIAMQNDTAMLVRRSVVAILEHLGQAVPSEALLAALNAKDDGVRQATIEMLGKLGMHAPLEPLIEATKDPVSWVATTAIKTLGKLDRRAPVELLLGFLKRPGGRVMRLPSFSTKRKIVLSWCYFS